LVSSDTTNPEGGVPAEARAALRRAMSLHSAGEIVQALEAGQRAIALAPDFAEAHNYLGNTLVTRVRRFEDGLASINQAAELAPEDAAILYTAGWCHEYVANALDRPRGKHQAVQQAAPELYAIARAYFLRALAAHPDDQMRGDIEDMLDVVAAVTGEPWADDERI
jgi:tetratricopeptide (TPR) repeat protein